MDLELHKRVNDQSLALVEKHRLFKHRFLSAYEFHHLVKESTVLKSESIESAPKYLIKSSIDVRRSILQRLAEQTRSTELVTASSVYLFSQSSSTSSSSGNPPLDFRTVDSSGSQRTPCDITFLEFQLHSEVKASTSSLKDRFARRKSSTERIAALKAKRDALALEVSAMEQALSTAETNQTALATKICNLTVSKSRLTRRQHDLHDPIVLLAQGWEASVGADMALSRSSVLRAAMNAFNDSARWALTTEGDAEAIKFLVRAGVLRFNASNILQVQLRL